MSHHDGMMQHIATTSASHTTMQSPQHTCLSGGTCAYRRSSKCHLVLPGPFLCTRSWQSNKTYHRTLPVNCFNPLSSLDKTAHSHRLHGGQGLPAKCDNAKCKVGQVPHYEAHNSVTRKMTCSQEGRCTPRECGGGTTVRNITSIGTRVPTCTLCSG